MFHLPVKRACQRCKRVGILCCGKGDPKGSPFGPDIETCTVRKKERPEIFCIRCHKKVHLEMHLSPECPQPRLKLCDLLAEDLQSVAVVDSKIVLSEKEVEIFSKLLKNGESSKSSWRTGSKVITDVKVGVTQKVGAVLYESHSWSDSGGGIGMSVHAKVQHEDTVYTTDVMQFRDSCSASKDRPYLFANSILSVRITQYEGSERCVELKLGPQRERDRWVWAKIPEKDSA